MSPAGNARQPSNVQISAPITANVTSGGTAFVAMPGSTNTFSTGLGEAQFIELQRMFVTIQGSLPPPRDDVPSLDPLERHLDLRIDRLRDAAADGDPDDAIRLFQDELDNLPDEIGRTIRFRLKANIGHRHFAKGDLTEASRWLLDAFDDAPNDPRAISNRVIGLWAGGDPEEAYHYAASMAKQDPTNEVLASYLPQVAAVLPSVFDPLEHVPDALRETEPVVAAHAIFLRQRDEIPEWWAFARSGHARFPESDYLTLLTAFSHVQEIGKAMADVGHPEPSAQARERLEWAAPILDAHWRQKSSVLKSRFNDGPYALAAAMIAYQLLADRDKAIELATSIHTKEIDDPKLVVQAVQVALAHAEMELAQSLCRVFPSDPDVAYQRGIVSVNLGDWPDAAAAFRIATVPEGDTAMVATFLKLEAIVSESPDQAVLQNVLEESADDIRSIVLTGRVAQRLNRIEVTQDAFMRAKRLVGSDTISPERFMVAALARDIGTPAELMAILEGHTNAKTDVREIGWLAQAHAMEDPHRQRNIAFFERLAKPMLDLPIVARAHASVLFDIAEFTQARPIFERLRRLDPGDTFVTLRLLQVYHVQGDEPAAKALLAGASVDPEGHAPENEMALAAQIAFAGNLARGYMGAYQVFRRHPSRGELAMGYISLDLTARLGTEVFQMTVAAKDACVVVRSSAGTGRTFVIDDGHGFFGLDVEPTNGVMAKLVHGKAVGDTFTVPKMTGDAEVWTIEGIHSKYLELHRQILEQFEARFPGSPGIAAIEVTDDMTNVFDVVRRRGESSLKIAQDYIRLGIPFAIAASLNGGNPVAFAEYLRSIDASIATCTGHPDETAEARSLTVRQVGAGIVLDPYAAWTAAQLQVLPALRATYGTLHVPRSTMDLVSTLLNKEREAIGTEQLSMAWHAGEFIKVVHSDENRRERIAYLETLMGDIEVNCHSHTVVLPDDTDDELAKIHLRSGAGLLDAGIIARQNEALLVSEDLHYRRLLISAGIINTGAWLQPALDAAYLENHLTELEYARAVAGLAMRRHGHVSLTPFVLYLICHSDDEQLVGFKAASRFIADVNADMVSHYGVITQFLRLAWGLSSDLGYVRRRAATGVLLEALCKGRRQDGRVWLAHLLRWFKMSPLLRQYIIAWVQGHFVDLQQTVQPYVATKSDRPGKRVRHRR